MAQVTPAAYLYVALFACLLAAFGTFVLWAVGRGKAIQREEGEALEATAKAHRWPLETSADGTGFSLSGNSDDGIVWVMRRERSSVQADGEPVVSTVTWFTGRVQHPVLDLVVKTRAEYDSFRQSPAMPLLRQVGVGQGTDDTFSRLLALHEKSRECAFKNTGLSQRFVALAFDDRLSEAVLSAEVEEALAAWCGPNFTLSLGAPDLRIDLGDGQLAPHVIEQTVALGLAAARAYLRGIDADLSLSDPSRGHAESL